MHEGIRLAYGVEAMVIQAIGNSESVLLGLDAMLEDDAGIDIVARLDLGIMQVLAPVAVRAAILFEQIRSKVGKKRIHNR